MNAKNKFIALVMSFVICFCTVSNSFANDKEHLDYNIKPLVVDGGVITAPMVATISSLAVASGIVLSSDDDIYDIARVFYNKHKDNWEDVRQVFDLCVSVGANKLITVGNDFLELVCSAFSDWFSDSGYSIHNSYGIPIGQSNGLIIPITIKDSYSSEELIYSIRPGVWAIDLYLSDSDTSTSISAYFSYGDNRIFNKSGSFSTSNLSKVRYLRVFDTGTASNRAFQFEFLDSSKKYISGSLLKIFISSYEGVNNYAGSFDIPYIPGSFDWDKVKDKEDDNGSVALPVPGDLGSLVGKPSDTFWDNTDNLVGGGSITLPGVGNPSISVTDDIFISSPSTDVPGVDSPGIDKPGIVFPPFGGGLDFTPITQSSFVDKFPFSLAKDIKNIVSVFDVEPKAPNFTVPIVSEELEIDLTQFNIWASIIRFFVLIGFMIALINITRKVIG